ncbi:MAG: crossover junction endodeoxyribonuclease RuvC [Pseudomonadota bacterium]
MTTILGIDPGSRITGYGVIKLKHNKPHYLSSGRIMVAGQHLSDKLGRIFDDISQICQQYQPDMAAIEQIFMHQNPGAALKLGQARGVAIAAMSCHNLQAHEYSARQIKQAVVGYGAAKKTQVQHMITTLLSLEKQPPNDAADALAIALCHAHTHLSLQVLNKRSTINEQAGAQVIGR